MNITITTNRRDMMFNDDLGGTILIKNEFHQDKTNSNNDNNYKLNNISD